MKIQCFADLHREFMHKSNGQIWPAYQAVLDQIREAQSDVLVLAGDSYYKGRTIKLATELASGRPVIVVAGNHEHYGSTYRHSLAQLRRKAAGYENVHFLENDAVEIGDIVFLGCTLWTDLYLFDQGPYRGLYPYELLESTLLGTMNDYRYIRWNRERPLQPFDSKQLHADSVAWLRNQFERYRGKQVVVVTHHAPSLRSVDEMYHQDAACAAYASHLDELVEQSGAVLWIHGHTHNRVDYRIGKTRVVSNCRGYDEEMAELIGFDPELVVEV